jgi:raffinose/stachyose/melibiose transport system substrate-binding protein
MQKSTVGTRNFTLGAFDTGFYDDQLYGMSSEQESLVVWYNKTLFNQNGWNPPSSFKEFTALNEQIQKKGYIRISFGTTSFRPSNDWWLAMAWNNYLGAVEFKKVLKNEVPWTSPLMQNVTSLFVELWKKGYISGRQSHAISIDDAWSIFTISNLPYRWKHLGVKQIIDHTATFRC